MHYSELFSKWFKRLENENKALNIQLLMEEAFHLSRTEFWTKKGEEITDRNALARFNRYMKRLAQDEPTAYILKKKYFFGEAFVVNRHVLIPRPETEVLVERALALTPVPTTILDIGAGSGAIAVMLAKHTGATVTAVDMSPDALRVLNTNIVRFHVEQRVTPVRADLFPPAGNTFDLIVSNPPYVSESEWLALHPSVKDYEPRLALVAGPDGLDVIRRIAENARLFLNPNGTLLLEFGYQQDAKVVGILHAHGFSIVDITRDYSGIPRVVAARPVS
ncbi:MAG: peptide chain release factor N(5)-glutamine methyltransferase [Candidatus Omnitrophota bacterium]